EQAGQIAEAGLNYYKWYLAHYPDDTTNGTGTAGPYIGIYSDPEGGAIGEYSLSVASTTYCGEISSIDVVSEGHTYANPDVRRTVQAHYARTSIAEYAYILNSNVWAGADRIITGPYHSNGGVRMDATNNSVVTSGQSTWSCNSSFGCTPTKTEDGVFTSTTNSNQSLFAFPSTPINFAGITVDLSLMRPKAQSDGLYFGPSGKAGYHLIFKSNGSVDVRRVNKKEKEPNGNAWGYYMHILNGTTLIGNYTPPSSCPLIFVEDQVWLEGVVNGKVTLAVADNETSGNGPSIILNDNITYANQTSGLLAMGEYDVLVGLEVPDDMEINGIFVAQNGHFGRNYYGYVPSGWSGYNKRNSLTVNGTIVSNGRVGTQWVCSPGSYYCSGFEFRFNNYDRNLVLSPPPMVPRTSDVYTFSDWRDK
ncbi:hypothetical protein CO026_02955, partial [Candidatus Kaiserbacteria bacterium CG_4_9_14_0_2_um_filter_41_32]